MVGKYAVAEFTLNPWADIKDDFEGSDLLLGNGFSRKISDVFSYSSLFSEFTDRCEANSARIFKEFGTTNFESIQSQLSNAKRVNDILGLPSDDFNGYIDELRNGLIATISLVHPRSENRDHDKLNSLSEQLAYFNDIFTLNYDIHLYEMIMFAKERYENGEAEFRYNDYFWDKDAISGDLRFTGFQTYKNYRHVYYIHGSLFIYRNGLETMKITRKGSDELIDIIASSIRKGKFPLFVSEGAALEKRKVIDRSPYLRFAIAKLSKDKNNVVVYGASLSDSDQHIVDALTSKEGNIAISIHSEGRSKGDLRDEMHDIKGKFGNKDVAFFDSSTLFNIP